VFVHWHRCSRFLSNTYRGHAELIVSGCSKRIFSKEGVTQGDPLSMLLYAIAIMPLINCLESSDIIQTWYADDSSCQGKLASVNGWWNKLNKYGPSVGYFPQGMKSFLITHPNNISEAQKVFRGSGIKIVTGHIGYIGESFEKPQ
jgi:hypothetical protein